MVLSSLPDMALKKFSGQEYNSSHLVLGHWAGKYFRAITPFDIEPWKH